MGSQVGAPGGAGELPPVEFRVTEVTDPTRRRAHSIGAMTLQREKGPSGDLSDTKVGPMPTPPPTPKPKEPPRPVSADSQEKAEKAKCRQRKIDVFRPSLRARINFVFRKFLLPSSLLIEAKEIITKIIAKFNRNDLYQREVLEDLIKDKFKEKASAGETNLEKIFQSIVNDLNMKEEDIDIVESSIFNLLDLGALQNIKNRREFLDQVKSRNSANSIENGIIPFPPKSEKYAKAFINGLTYFDTDDVSREKATQALIKVYEKSGPDQKVWLKKALRENQAFDDTFKNKLETLTDTLDTVKSRIKDQAKKGSVDFQKATENLVNKEDFRGLAVRAVIEHFIEEGLSKEKPQLQQLVCDVQKQVLDLGMFLLEFGDDAFPSAIETTQTIIQTANQMVADKKNVKGAKGILKQTEKSLELAQKLNARNYKAVHKTFKESDGPEQLIRAAFFISSPEVAAFQVGSFFKGLSPEDQKKLLETAKNLSTSPDPVFREIHDELTGIFMVKPENLGDTSEIDPQILLRGLRHESNATGAYNKFKFIAYEPKKDGPNRIDDFNNALLLGKSPVLDFVYFMNKLDSGEPIRSHVGKELNIAQLLVQNISKQNPQVQRCAAALRQILGALTSDNAKKKVREEIQSLETERPKLVDELKTELTEVTTDEITAALLDQLRKPRSTDTTVQLAEKTLITELILEITKDETKIKSLSHAIAHSEDPGGLLTSLLLTDVLQEDKALSVQIRAQVVAAKKERKAALTPGFENAKAVVSQAATGNKKVQFAQGQLTAVERTGRGKTGKSQKSKDGVKNLLKTLHDYAAVCDTLEEREEVQATLSQFVRSDWGKEFLKNNPEIQTDQQELSLSLYEPKKIPNAPTFVTKEQLIKNFILNNDPGIRLNGLLSYRWCGEKELSTENLFQNLAENWDSYSPEEQEAALDFCLEWCNNDAINAKEYVNINVSAYLSAIAAHSESTSLLGKVKEFNSLEFVKKEQEAIDKFAKLAEKEEIDDADIQECASWIQNDYDVASNFTRMVVLNHIQKINEKATNKQPIIDQYNQRVYNSESPKRNQDLKTGSKSSVEEFKKITSGELKGEKREEFIDQLSSDLKLIAGSLYANISMDELTKCAYQKGIKFKTDPSEDKEKILKNKGENLLDLINYYNRTAKYFIKLLLDCNNSQEATKIFEFLIDLSEKLNEKGDFLTSQAIITAMEDSSVNRLKKGFTEITPEYEKKYNNLKNLSSSQSAYSNYRNKQKSEIKNHSVHLNYNGPFLSDLTFIEDGNPDKDPDNVKINLRKILLTAPIMSHFENSKKTGEQIKKEGKFNFNLDSLLYDPVSSDAVLYQRSLAVFPRNANDDPLFIASQDPNMKRRVDKARNLVLTADSSEVIEMINNDANPPFTAILIHAVCQNRLANNDRKKFMIIFDGVNPGKKQAIVAELLKREKEHHGVKYKEDLIATLEAKIEKNDEESTSPPSFQQALARLQEVAGVSPSVGDVDTKLDQQLEDLRRASVGKSPEEE